MPVSLMLIDLMRTSRCCITNLDLLSAALLSLQFTAAGQHIHTAVLAVVNPSVSLSRAGIVSKQLQLRLCGLHRSIPHDSTCSFLLVNFTAKLEREHRERGCPMRGGGKNP